MKTTDTRHLYLIKAAVLAFYPVECNFELNMYAKDKLQRANETVYLLPLDVQLHNHTALLWLHLSKSACNEQVAYSYYFKLACI